MCNSRKFTNNMATTLEMVEKDNKFLRKEVQLLREEIDLLRTRIPPCPCGFIETKYCNIISDDTED